MSQAPRCTKLREKRRGWPVHRIKIMTDQELCNFKLFSVSKIVFNSFGRTAIFIGPTTRAGRLMLLCGQHVRYLERISPGGWEDCSNASDRRWHLLAGTSSAFESFGLEEDAVGNGAEANASSNVYYIDSFAGGDRAQDRRGARQYDYNHW